MEPVSDNDLKAFRFLSRRYRNRRIGEFLKELDMTEGRGTGIPKVLHAIRANGSPEPVFHTDPDRTFFLAELLLHPAFAGELVRPSQAQVEAQVAHDGAHDQAHEPMSDTERAILVNCLTGPASTPRLLSALGYKTRTGNFKKAIARLLASGYVEMTLPDSRRSKNQKYRLTERGKAEIGKMKDER